MTLRFTIVLAGLAALPACATVPAQSTPPLGPTLADNHKIGVSETSARIELDVDPVVSVVNDGEKLQIAAFAHDYIVAGHGALILSAPSGAANSDSASIKSNHVRMTLVEAGIPYSEIAGSTYDAQGSQSPRIVLTFTRYIAEAPECAPLWTQDLAHQENNQTWASFGCANRANLAAMLEDPHDLLAPRDAEARDSGRRGVVFGAYRQGAQTHAERSSDERISISEAISD